MNQEYFYLSISFKSTLERSALLQVNVPLYIDLWCFTSSLNWCKINSTLMSLFARTVSSPSCKFLPKS